MTALVAAGGAGVLAHAVHYGIVAGGVVVLTLLLAPGVLHRVGGPPGATPDAHDRRVAALRAGLAAGVPVVTTDVGVAAPAAPATDAVGPGPRPAAAGWLPVVATGSVGAAAVHATVCPEHLREGLLLGLFFLLCALAQLAWSGLVLWAPAGRGGLLVSGVAGNLALVGVWALSRTTGLPVGPETAREPVGGWDVAAVLLELVVVGGCARLAAARRAAAARPGRCR